MKILRTIIASFLMIIVMLVFSGCGNFKNSDNKWTETRGNQLVKIYDEDNREIGSFSCMNYSAFVNNKILYKRELKSASSLVRMEYWLHDIETNSDYKLGAVDDWMHEGSYDTVEADNHLYVSISTGEYGKIKTMKQTIYDIDLLMYSMSPILEIEEAIPYNSFTVANNKLILAELLHDGNTGLVEYDLNETHTSTVIHTYDESDCFVQDSIRHIYSDSENIYMVRLHRDDSETNYFLYLDKYDFDYNLLNTIDIRDFCDADYLDQTEESKVNEWKQFIAFFFVHNDLVYYQNFSSTLAMGIIENDKIDSFFDVNVYFSYVSPFSESVGSDLFIQLFAFDEQNRNKFYLVDFKTHEVKAAEFFADENRYTFFSAMRDNDKILLTMGYKSPATGERLPDRLYYIDMNDLDFKPIESPSALVS